MKRKIWFILLTAFSFSVSNLFSSNLLYAQLSDTARDQKEAAIEDRPKPGEQEPQTAQQIIEWLKKRAETVKQERRRKELLQFDVSTGVSWGHESNPANDALQKSDFFNQGDFSIYWKPKFNNTLSGNFGYRYTEQFYYVQEALSTADYTFSTALKYYPFESGKLLLEPSLEYEWLVYPYDASSSNEQFKSSLNIKHYTTQNWNIGGKYEYSDKIYDKKAARNTDQLNLNFHRRDYRNSLEFWVKRYLGKWAFTLKEKSFRNNSNEEFQKFYDYDSTRGYFTMARSFLKDDKLYVTHTSDYEVKAYRDRLADEKISRHDQIIQHKMTMYYTLKEHWTLDYSITYKKSGSNDATGVFKDVTNKLGLTADF